VKYYDVQFPSGYVDSKPGLRPRGPLDLAQAPADAERVVREHLATGWRSMARPPVGMLRRPFLVPGSTYDQLWDWDAFFIACALPPEGLEYGVGSIANLLDRVREDGRPPKMADGNGALVFSSQPLPVHAQFAAIMARRTGGYEWLAPLWPKLVAIRAWYERETTVAGRFVWLGHRGNGLDNNPSVYGRPPMSVAGIDLACWHAREYQAMAALARALGQPGADNWQQRFETLRALIRDRYWDQIDELFYATDMRAEPGQAARQGVNWELFLKFRNWASFFPLWARLATPQQAAALRAKLLDPAEFLAPGGIRSHSARDPIYNNAATGNPSNWQGPVWGLSTALCAYGLAAYGWRDDALEVAGRTVKLFAADIARNGCLHEFYHGDTSQPLLNPGFLSWNLLALPLLEDLRAGGECCAVGG
jgi:putative isomerase